MPDATHTTLCKQVAEAIWDYRFAHGMAIERPKPMPVDYAIAASALVVFAERERLLRERIEALRLRTLYEDGHNAAFNEALDEALAELDK